MFGEQKACYPGKRKGKNIPHLSVIIHATPMIPCPNAHHSKTYSRKPPTVSYLGFIISIQESYPEKEHSPDLSQSPIRNCGDLEAEPESVKIKSKEKQAYSNHPHHRRQLCGGIHNLIKNKKSDTCHQQSSEEPEGSRHKLVIAAH